MYPRVLHYALVLVVISYVSMVSTVRTQAASQESPRFAGSPHDLIDAVNALRASHGLPPYAIDDMLMAAAQGHAEYMAATGNVSHTGAGGSSASERILALGYPLAGVLSLGGFKAENITSGNESMSAQQAVNQWTGDALHLNTMISPNLTEIGAGVAVNGGRVYYVIDCARPTDSGVPQAAGSSTLPAGPTNPPGVSGVIIPVVVVTPNMDGDVIHEVKAGQTLWQLAISYETKIDEIKRLNNLFDNEIYPGMKLLVKKGAFLSTSVPTGTAALAVTSTPTIRPALTATVSLPATTGTTATSMRVSPGSTRKVVMGIIALAILGGSLVAWWGNKKKG